MKQFRATVRASGVILTTVVFAENANFATKLLQAQFELISAKISEQLHYYQLQKNTGNL